MNKKRIKIIDSIFPLIGLLITLLGLAVLAALLVDAFLDGHKRLNLSFFTSYPSRKPDQAGILSAWVGTVWIMCTTAMIAVPFGVAAGIYLEEYARKNKLTDFIEINIANLAGVPSVIYGILGLGIFVRMMHLERSVLSGGLILALLVLPIIILATREALRSVPSSIRAASYALGATKWQTIRFQVLPAAKSQIFTGIILAMSRAIGETAPLIVLGALTYIPFLPTHPVTLSEKFPFLHVSFQGFLDPFTVLPIQIFNWVSRPQKGFLADAAAGIIVLLVITFVMNGVAVYLRYKSQKKLS
ncbi:MAG TPA: phosphate ABC transporter permease PtsA [Candidatus Omnitrophica bacterium]|nr:MAG: phosphate ABC transporter, permease protein PstA [Omnitrophica WOR_2 bacterium GWA2_45_18]HBR14492.1 phosphate ABC transporter permease PtsA [Candidatus Omnitrophota bacterium]